GRNGAGKSTLLKILSRITEPTHGRAVMRGRVSSLLEVGTGFHPELTGRENIYMNGTILGMKKKEIDRKFDEIVDFSGVEKFLDTPTKRYSSGMQVRLAFAVAAHLEPEILIIDEVLAVGDADFQKKCLGKMQDVAKGGRTVLFVSHNLAAVENLCSRVVTLSHGVLSFDGSPADGVREYLSDDAEITGFRDLTVIKQGRTGLGDIRFKSVHLESLGGERVAFIRMGDGFRIGMRLQAHQSVSGVVIAIAVFNENGIRICGLNSSHTSRWTLSQRTGHEGMWFCVIQQVNLGPGTYRLNLQLKSSIGNVVFDSIQNAFSFRVEYADIFGTGCTAFGSNIVFFQPNWAAE
ncbi:MAG: ABC transporter ATP-binding protein, partial [Planctomycetaceae bacterium]|nr:ABC transporter ATP-binding protein [Planctomycetaceae bacterium]